MEEIIDLKYKSLKEVLISIFVGFSIGMSVVVPGISGSTIAIIMKVYDKMMYSFSNLFKKFKACFLFLVPIGIGVLFGVVLGFVLVKLLLDLIPFITICLFVGLMAGTYPILLKEIKGQQVSTNRRVLFAIGLIVPLVVTALSFFAGGNRELVGLSLGNYVLFVLIGVLVSLTQIIPGLSATVLLMMFGYYKSLLDGIGSEMLKSFDILLVYISMIVGFAIGILLFSKVIDKLLSKQKIPFFFVICGLSLGSMISVFFGNECVEIYSSWSGGMMAIDLIIGVLSFAVGFGATFALYIRDKKKNEREANL